MDQSERIMGKEHNNQSDDYETPKSQYFYCLQLKSNFRMRQERRGKGRGGVTHPIAKGNQNLFHSNEKIPDI